MAKKAFLVTLSVTTRVCADSEDSAIDSAIKKISDNASEYIIADNLDAIVEDNEIPYGDLETDKL